MSLRARLAATIAVAFLAILLAGALLTYVHAQRRVTAELDAARTVAINRVAQLIAELPASPNPPRDLQTFVRAFNGDRHVQILLIDATGMVRVASTLARADTSMPGWFAGLLGTPARTTVMPLSGGATPLTAAAISVDPRSELAEVWADLGLNLAMLALFVLLSFALISAVAGRALRPLAAIRDALAAIGRGDEAPRMPVRGPPELAALTVGYNDMAARLEEMAARNRRLSEQLLRMQDEERAELARDLHDEVGPSLFAIDVDAAGIERLVRQDAARPNPDGIAERAASIRKAAAHAKLEVRRILGALRPGLLPGLGFKAATQELMGDLASRHPGIRFQADIDEGDFGEATETLLLRVVREAVHNALRHGRPGRIAVRLSAREASLAFSVVDDGGGLPAGGAAGGYGLTGMRERVEAAGGRLVIVQVPLPAGVRIEGELPLRRDERDLSRAGRATGRAA